MVPLQKNHFHSSTLVEKEDNSTNMKYLWNNSADSGSLSSIEHLYEQEKIKKIVDDLVMSKFGNEYHLRCLKSSSRRSRCRSSSETTSSISISLSGSLEFSVGADSLSRLISLSDQRTWVIAHSEFNNYAENSDTNLTYTINTNNSSAETESYVASRNFGDIIMLDRIRAQILKALHLTETSIKTTNWRARLEAEKLLLTTDLTMNLLSQENISASSSVDMNFLSGTIEISNIHLWSEKSHHNDEHFLCVVTNNSELYASEVSKVKSNGVIYFKKKFVISSLHPDFNLNVRIYSVSPKLLTKCVRPQTICYHRNSRYEDEVPLRESFFTLWGEINLTRDDLFKPDGLRIKVSCGFFTASVSSHADCNIFFCGFLDVSQTSMNLPWWNKQWCVLNQNMLKYYNYPLKEPCHGDPSGVVDLSSCNEVRRLTREECPRKQTLLLNMNGCKNVLLSFESQQDLECWENYLKINLMQMKLWEMP